MYAQSMSESTPPLIIKYISLLKDIFTQLDDETKREFWKLVGERDDMLTGPSNEEVTVEFVHKRLEGKNNVVDSEFEFINIISKNVISHTY